MPDPQQAIRVEVPGMGLVEFPAGTPQEVMAAAIRQHLDSQTPALQKFASNAWDMVNPMGLINAGLHPVDTAKAIYQSHVDQAGKAYDAYKRAQTEPLYGGVLPLSGMEAVGHGLATVLPVVGPAAASAGEDIGSGQYAKGLGKATGLLAGAYLGSKVPDVALKVAKAPAAVGDYLNQPSIMAARRNARIATQDAAELTNKAKYDAAIKADLDKYTVAKKAHEDNLDLAEAAARQRQADAAAHAQRVQAATTSTLADMEPTQIVTDVRGQSPILDSSGQPFLKTIQFEKPSPTTMAMTDMADRLGLMKRTGMEVPTPPSVPSPEALRARPVYPDFPPPEAYTPLARETLPPAFGPQTRGGELAALAGAGLLGKSAIGNLWDKFFQ